VAVNDARIFRRCRFSAVCRLDSSGDCHSWCEACVGAECPDLVRCCHRICCRNRRTCLCDQRCVGC
jgi:hypothetical protein